LTVYGIGRQRSAEEWRGVARALLHQGLIDETQDGYPVLSLNAQSGQVLREELIVRIAAPVKRNRARSSASAGTGTGTDPSMAAAGTDSSALFERLRALRKRLADEHGLPPYVVFHDATLREMAEHRPLTLSQFAELPGVGQAKLARYGEHFIAAVAEHLSQNRS
jgi:ATP-dependent DNA helicase RecQ